MRANDQALNRLAVLKAIRRSGPVSRSELPRLTGLSGGTITQVTSEFLQRGLIEESRDAPPGRGRPRTQIQIRAAGAVVVGASVTPHDTLTVSFVDLCGNRMFVRDIALPVTRTLEQLADNVAACLADVIATSPFQPNAINRIGIALPGIIDSIRGVVHFITTLPLGPFPVAERIARQLDVPVTIEADGMCMARAEHWFGRAQHLENFHLIHIGAGISSADYVDGLPRSGASGINSELGHVKVATDEHARLCYCGANGCLTAYSSTFGMVMPSGLSLAEIVAGTTDLDARFEALLESAQSGDAAALRQVGIASRHLGIAVANRINASDPGTVLILTPNARYIDLVRDGFERALIANALSGIRHANAVIFEVAHEEWRWKGTAALALEQTYLARDAMI